MNAESAYALAARAAQAATMVAAASCVITRFSLPEQGLFFVFLSFSALVQAGDFGLGYAALQVASHLAHDAHDPLGRARVAALLQRARRLAWWSLGATALGVAIGGAALLAQRMRTEGAAPEAASGWIGPWFAYLVALWLAHRVNVELMLLEGARSARVAWRIRTVQEVASGIVFVGALLAGAGLWSLALHALARSAISGALLAAAHRESAPDRAVVIDWRREVWPFQWRIGLSVLSGFLVYQAMNPIVLLHQGSAAAGRFGIALAVMNLLLLITGAWPSSLAARWGGLLAAGRIDALRRSFRRTLAASTLLALLLGAAVLGVWLALGASAHPLAVRVAARLADAGTMAALLAMGLVHHVVGVLAVLMRAERREPLLGISLVGGVVVVAAVWFAARTGSLLAPALASAAIAIGGLLWTLRLYRGFADRVFGAAGGAGAGTGTADSGVAR